VQEIQPPTIHNLELRPMRKKRQRKPLPGWMLPGAAIALATAGVLLFLAFRQNDTVAKEQPAAVPPVAATPAVVHNPAPTAVVQPPAAAPIASVVAPPQPEAETNLVETVEEPVVQDLEPLKLQAILFSKTRPSAYVGGKTVFIGSRVRDFQVASITATSITLVSQAETNILTMDHH
jgi:hypothetical protein